MRIRIGSRVRFLNDTGGGIVRSFTDDKIAIVETDDGFEMPVLVTDLLPDMPASYETGGNQQPAGDEEKQEPVKKEKPDVSFEEKKYRKFSGEVFLAIVPQNEQVLHVSNFDLFIVNDSNYYFNYTITLKDAGISTLVTTGTIEPDTKLAVEEFSQTSIGKIISFHLQGTFYKEGLLDIADPVNYESSTEAYSFYKIGNFTENAYFQQRAVILKKPVKDKDLMQKAVDELKKSDMVRIVESKEKKEAKITHKSPKNTNLEEVDLHIEEIVEDSSGLTNGEIISIQMGRFETALETALRSKVQRIVFIHGVGNGRLKHELRKKLDRKYPDLKYQDASFREYGYGATMVYLT
jgi:hypothetical protein